MAERTPEHEGVVEGEQERGDSPGRGGGGRVSSSGVEEDGCVVAATNGVGGASGREREDVDDEGSGAG